MGRTLALAVVATTADTLWSIGVFLGVPGVLLVALVVRELRRLRRERARDRAEAESMSAEGFAPGPPLDEDDEP